MTFGWAIALSIGLTALAAAFAGIGTLALLSPRRPAAAPGLFADRPAGTVLLFDGETLVDASPAARSMLAAASVRGSPWQRLMSFLSLRFPQVEERIASLQHEGQFVLDSLPSDSEGRLTLCAEWRGGLTRLSLSGPEDDGKYAIIDPMTQRAMVEELTMLREIVAKAPFPIWLEHANGIPLWSNLDYMLRAEHLISDDETLGWPLPRLAPGPIRNGQRIQLGSGNDGADWVEARVCATPVGKVIFGVPITPLVQAEASLREFTQTLTKTFAHLPIGLAIFDRHRRLALFNPALLDLTTLPIDFLTSRPTLSDCLDRMRELRMIPEPRDYRQWRRRMAEIEEEASSGIYEEIWHLPGAQIYRVLGRPHPDGALALLFEDITTETTRTRRYRADVELGQSVLDAVGEAVAVFSAAGLLVMSNAAYAALWGHDPSGFVGADSSIVMLAAHWRGRTAPSKLWSQAETFVGTLGDRREWSAVARLDDGRSLTCRFVPLPGGSTMITFRITAAKPRKLGLEPKAPARRRA
jgi:PAS domain-containing protein